MFFSGMTEVNTDIITPELAVGDDFEQAVELAKRAAASRDAQWAREEGINVEQHRILVRGGLQHVYVLNPGGDCVVKRFRSMGEATIQRDTMNTLYNVLRDAECPVSSVRVLAMASNGVLPPAAVIERAPGISINSQFMPEQAYYDHFVSCYLAMMEELKVARQHLDQALGRIASRILVNDICSSNNAGNNIFTHTVNGEKRFTLIDQPFTWLPGCLYRAALLGLQMRSWSSLRQAGFTDSRV
jgi:hypothetical protein